MLEDLLVSLTAIKELLGSYDLIYLTLFGFILLFSRFMIMDYKPDIWKKFSYIDKLALSFIIGVIAFLGILIFIPFILLAQGKLSFETSQYDINPDISSVIIFIFLYGLLFLFIKIDSKKPTDILKKYFMLTILSFFTSIFLSAFILSIKSVFEGEIKYFIGFIIIGLVPLLLLYIDLAKMIYDYFDIKLPLYDRLSKIKKR